MIITILVSIYPLVTNNIEVPLGIVIGLSIGAFLYALTGILELKNVDTNWLLATNFLRLFVLAGALFGFAWLYYKSNIHVVNIFGVVGGYTADIIILIVLSIFDKKKEKDTK